MPRGDAPGRPYLIPPQTAQLSIKLNPLRTTTTELDSGAWFFAQQAPTIGMALFADLSNAADHLHAHLLRKHYDHGLLRGPDAGVRFNLRLWRFLKSALDFLPWHDDFVFMQTQGYWVLANWMLHESTREPRYRDVALESTEATLKLQRPDGSWAYPLP